MNENSLRNADWSTIDEISRWYGKSNSAVRLEIKNKIRKQFGSESAAEGKVFERGFGRNGHSYEPEFVKNLFGKRPGEGLSQAQRHVFSRQAKAPTINVVGVEADSPLVGLLQSRMKATESYNTLVTEMITFGHGLRIRCISGTDFFNAHNPIGDAFFQRDSKELGNAKVLLLWPFGHGAEIRSAAEGEERKNSQFSRDAAGTFLFMRAYATSDKLKLEPKWVDDLPSSLLVWTEECSLLEPYDHGREFKDRVGCIGRKAPVMVVNANAPYHRVLKEGFDYVFNKDSNTHIDTYNLKAVSNRFEKSGALQIK